MSALVANDSSTRASRVQKVLTPGGVEAWLVEDYAVPLVAMEFAMKGGTAQDPAGREGAATMLAGLLDEGAGELDADAFHRALDDKAVEISFSSERDQLTGRLKSLTRHVDAAFDLIRLAVSEPRLDADAIERIRSQMLAQLRREAKDPGAMAGKAWREAAFGDHPYGRPSRGSLDSVAQITREDLLAMRRAVLTRGQLKIAVVGAIDAGHLARLLDRVFATLPAQGVLRPVPDVAMANGGARRIIDVDVPQSTIQFGLPGIARKDPDHMPATVVNHILGGGVFSARLFKEVREKRGLAYSVHSQLATLDHAAWFAGGTSTKNERAAESLRVIEDEIAGLASGGPTEDELDKAKKYLIGSYALRFDTSTKIAGQLVGLQTEGFPVEYLDERNRLIAAVTMEDARRVAHRLFDDAQLLVAIAGRPEGF